MATTTGKAPGAITCPRPEDFSDQARDKALREETLKVTKPAAGVAIVFGALSLVSPVFLVFAAGAFALGAGHYWYNQLSGNAAVRAKAYMEKLMEQKRRFEESQLRDLQKDCAEVGFAQGVRAATQLSTTFARLQEFLSKGPGASESGRRFLMLAEDSLKEGLGYVQQAKAIKVALRAMPVPVVTAELQRLKMQRSQKADGSVEAQALDKQIEVCEQKLASYHKYDENLNRIMAQVSGIVSALEQTHLELTDLGNQDVNTFLNQGGATERLQTAVEAAHQVEQALRGEDPESLRQKALDNEYLQAAQQLDKN